MVATYRRLLMVAYNSGTDERTAKQSPEMLLVLGMFQFSLHGSSRVVEKPSPTSRRCIVWRLLMMYYWACK